MHVQPSRVLAQGVVAGAIGYATVVLAYALIDLITGDAAFATVTRLATALRGSPDAVDSGALIAVNGIHLLAGLVAGTGASLLINEWEVHPAAGYFVFFVLIAGLIAGSFASAVLIGEYAHAVGWTTILVVNAVAAAAMLAYLLAVHPVLRREAARMGEA
jgi:hypothetical protein